MREWKELNPRTLEIMKEFGNFGPTTNPANGEIKGTMCDAELDVGKVYFDSKDLREYAKAFKEVADWLDARKLSAIAK